MLFISQINQNRFPVIQKSMNTATCLNDKTDSIENMQDFSRYSKFPLFVIASVFLIASLDTVYAQPLDEVATTVLESENSVASVQLTWTHDDAVSDYEVGCVSCIPNFSENTTADEIVLQNVTSLENGLAIFYIIAYDSNDEIIVAKQVLLELNLQ